MATNNTAIEWTHRPGTTGETWNPVVAYRWIDDPKAGERKRLRGWYCEHATTGCINCYSERQNIAGARGGTRLPFKPGHRDDVEIELHEPTLLQPLKWKSPRTIFVCSMSDLYGEWVKDEWLDKIKAVQALTPQHTYIELTKRAERMREYVAYRDSCFHAWIQMPRLATKSTGCQRPTWPLSNVWLGVSCERQQEADERIPLLLQTPAAVRFISAEPLLGAIDLRQWTMAPCDARAGHVLSLGVQMPTLDWVIVGGESGPNARPMHPAWARELRDSCCAGDVPFFFKQWGGWAPHKPVAGGDLGGDVRAGRVCIVHPTGQSDVEVSIATGGHSTIPGSRYMIRLGKKAAGRLLDGREHNDFPVIEGSVPQSGLLCPDENQKEATGS